MHNLGGALVTCVLQDITRDTDVTAEVFHYLPQRKQWFVTDTVSPSALAQAVIAAGWRYPHVSGVSIKYLEREGINVVEAIETGLKRYPVFPAFRVWDSANHRNVVWDGKSILRVENASLSKETETRECTTAVKLQLVAQGLISTTKVQSVLANVSEFPWVPQILAKLQGENLSETEKLKILTYMTCLIFKAAYPFELFVAFDSLSTMHNTLPLSHKRLTELEILDTKQHPHLYKREGVPYTLPHKSLDTAVWIQVNAEKQKSCKDVTVEQGEEEHVDTDKDFCHVAEGDDDITAGGTADLRPQTERSKWLMPQAGSSRWQSSELDILKSIPVNLSKEKAYKIYCTSACKQNIILRSKRAFELQMGKIRSKDVVLSKAIENSILASFSNESSKDTYMTYRYMCADKGIKPKSYLTFSRLIKKQNNK